MERRVSLTADFFHTDPDKIASLSGSEDQSESGPPSPQPHSSGASTTDRHLLSPKREWSLLKYSSKFIPKSIKKFGDTIRSFSQSDDEALEKSKMSNQFEYKSALESQEKQEKKILRIASVGKSQEEEHSVGQGESHATRKMKMPQRAKSHPLPRSTSTYPFDKKKLGKNVVPSHVPEILVTQPTASSETESKSPPPNRPTQIHTGQPAKCKQCAKFVEDLKRVFKNVRTRREKYTLLTSLPPKIIAEADTLSREFGCSTALAYSAVALRSTHGVFSALPPQFIEHIPEYVKSSINNFFEENENCGNMKARDDPYFFWGVKRKAMFISLSELYHEYLQVYLSHHKYVNISRFAYFIPRHVVWTKPFRGNSYNSCMIHENLQLMLQSCTTYYSEGIFKVLKISVCSENNIHCMFGLCENCPLPGSLNMLTYDCDWDEDVQYHFWTEETVFSDCDQDLDLAAASPPMKLSHFTEPAPVFTERLYKLIHGKFLKHQFIYSMQKEYLMNMNSFLCIHPGVALVKMDFCEPYQALSKIGPMKSNLVDFDPENTIAVHPFCVKFFDLDKGRVETRYVVVISNLLEQDASSSFIFRTDMIKWLRHTLPGVKKVVYFSDDNPKHFKNPENIFNLLFHEEDFKLRADHEFTQEGHDSHECEMIVTKIKRRARLACLRGDVEISNAKEMFEFCRAELAGYDLQFSFVNGNVGRITNAMGKLAHRYKLNDGIIPGLKMFNSFRPEFRNMGFTDVIHLRRYSLSRYEKLVQIRVSSSHAEANQPFGHHVTQFLPEVERRGGGLGLDPRKFVNPNLVNVNIEGVVYHGKIKNHKRVANGELMVTFTGKMEKKLMKKNKGVKDCLVKWKVERTAWVSTLDVVSVSEAFCEEESGSDVRGYLRRFSTVSIGRKEVAEVTKEIKENYRRSSSLSSSKIYTSLEELDGLG